MNYQNGNVSGLQFDYKLNDGQYDHQYLEKHGYHCLIGSDCSCYVKGFGNLNPTSYGNWGSLFTFPEEEVDGYSKSFHVFCGMYEEGVIRMWRIGFYIDSIEYVYDDDQKAWKKRENYEWKSCENPL